MLKSRWNVRVSCYNRVVRQVDIAQSIGNHFLLIRNDSQCSVRWLPAIRVHSSWISQENLKSHLDFYLRCWPVDKNPRKHSTTKKHCRKVENESFSKSPGSSKSVHGAPRTIGNKIADRNLSILMDFCIAKLIWRHRGAPTAVWYSQKLIGLLGGPSEPRGTSLTRRTWSLHRIRVIPSLQITGCGTV